MPASIDDYFRNLLERLSDSEPELPGFPHHKHNPTDVAPVRGDPPDLVAVLVEVETCIR
jgi:hypothetical protein